MIPNKNPRTTVSFRSQTGAPCLLCRLSIYSTNRWIWFSTNISVVSGQSLMTTAHRHYFKNRVELQHYELALSIDMKRPAPSIVLE